MNNWFGVGLRSPASRLSAAAKSMLRGGIALASAGARAVLHSRIIGAQFQRSFQSARRWLTRNSLPVISQLTVLALGLAITVPTIAASDPIRKVGPTARASGSSASAVVPIETAQAKPSHWFELSAEATAIVHEEVVSAPAPPPPPPPPPPPAPKVVAPAPPPPSGTTAAGLAAIHAAFDGSPGLDWALRVAKCESGYNPRAYNPSSGASGLFQFLPSTWNARSHPAFGDIWDPYAQARAARYYYDHGMTNAWSCK